MSTKVSPLRLRLFLEGIEVPVISAQVQIQQGQAAVAAIQVIPTDSVFNLLPRTLVHLFYRDPELTVKLEVDDKGKLPNTFSLDESTSPDDGRFDNYRLLYCGEVVGIDYQKSSFQRAATLQCMDLSSYWDTAYQWFADYQTGEGLIDVVHHFLGASGTLFDNIASGTTYVLGELLRGPPANPKYSNAGGLLGGFIRMLEAVGGINPRASSYQSYRGCNDFFSIAELRYNLSAMIGALENDETSINFYNAKAFRSWLMNGMTSAGSLMSFRDLLQLVGSYIFHDVYPNPAAKFEPGQKNVPRIVLASADTDIKAEGGKQGWQSALSEISAQITGIVPEFRNSDGVIRTEFIDDLKSIIGRLESVSGQITSSASVNDDEKSKSHVTLGEALTDLNKALSKASGGSTDQESGMTNFGDDKTGQAVGRLLSTAASNIQNFLGSNTKRYFKKVVNRDIGDHLLNQLILPETFFTVPPKCNVIFPTQYDQLNYSRNFLREITRLACHSGLGFLASDNGISSRILGSYYYAPNLTLHNKKATVKSIFGDGTILMPHEIHSGIIPKMEWVSDGQRWGVIANRDDPDEKDQEQRNIGYLQRLANFQFFSYRWMSRSMSVSGRFNPMLVIGFPGVVIDQTGTSAAARVKIAEVLNNKTAIFPTAFVGKIAAITHQISQEGGNTSVQFTHCRTHRGLDDEFLGVLRRETAAKDQRIVEFSTAAPADDNRVGRDDHLNEAHGRTLTSIPTKLNKLEDEHVKLISLYLDGRLEAGTVFGRAIIKEVDLSRVTSSFLVGDLEGVGIKIPLANESRIDIPSFFLVLLESTVLDLSNTILSSEEAAPEKILKPGWYDPSWTPEKITENVYQPLLGCSAVVDNQPVSGQKDIVKLISKLTGKDIQLSPDGTMLSVDGNTVPGTNLQYDVKTRLDPKTKRYVSSIGESKTTEQAIDNLIAIYSVMRDRTGALDSFVRDYTHRPIATMLQILGTVDLDYDEELNVVAGKEGFHSRAFGDYNSNLKWGIDTRTGKFVPSKGDRSLANLVPRSALPKYNTRMIAEARAKAIPAELDPRGRSWTRVKAYVSELQLSRGLQGA